MDRRNFTFKLAALYFGTAWASRTWGADELLRTPTQTRGPFYPIPEIEKQSFFDVDLTRKNDASPLAEGEVVAIRGTVVDFSGKSLDRVFVEIWQACHSGRYSHPNDNGASPLDPNFQYWGRMETGVDGLFSFKTILPGKYPGRTPHIHFRVVAPRREILETQLYFQANEELNSKDGVYNSVPAKQRKSVTTALENQAVDAKDPNSPKLPTGLFQIVLGPTSDAKSTPGNGPRNPKK